MTTSSFESGIFDPLTGGEDRNSRRPADGASTPGAGGSMDVHARAWRDALLNNYFDGRLSRERLRSAMRADPRLAVDFERMEAVLSEMNLRERAVGGPDVSQAVLDRVHEVRPYVDAPIRRQVSSARIAAVGAVLCGITLVVTLNQVRVVTAPSPRVDDEPRHVSEAAPVQGSVRAATPKPAYRTAGLENASKYDAVQTGLGRPAIPTEALDHSAVLSLVGGYTGDDTRFSPIVVMPVSRLGERDRFEWTSFFGYPMLVRVPTDGMAPASAKASLGKDHSGEGPGRSPAPR
jgi:hypothetical protein